MGQYTPTLFTFSFFDYLNICAPVSSEHSSFKNSYEDFFFLLKLASDFMVHWKQEIAPMIGIK